MNEVRCDHVVHGEAFGFGFGFVSMVLETSEQIVLVQQHHRTILCE